MPKMSKNKIQLFLTIFQQNLEKIDVKTPNLYFHIVFYVGCYSSSSRKSAIPLFLFISLIGFGSHHILMLYKLYFSSYRNIVARLIHAHIYMYKCMQNDYKLGEGQTDIYIMMHHMSGVPNWLLLSCNMVIVRNMSKNAYNLR